MPKVKYFAVAVGREGPKIYDNWTECDKNSINLLKVTRYPGGKHKSFPTRREAQEWLDAHARRGSIPRRGPPVGAEVIVIDSEDSDSAPSARKMHIKPSAPKRAPPVRNGDDSDDTDMEIEIISPPQSGVGL
ncbi:hypothetical protein CPB85DRAFT_1427550 [Mucidula mucida]|nr:hypothetical protein CPB85DRAFT_1427550 [Mucidula mucida]